MRELVAVVALLFGVAAAFACGGSGDGLSMEEYVEQVARALRDTDARVEEISEPLSEIGGAQPVDQQIEAARTYLSDLVPIADELDVTLRALDAPSEAEEAHEALIAAWEGLRDRGQETLDVLEGAETQSQLEGEFGLFLQDSSAGVFAACRGLQDVVDGAAVDLACET
jgi:hypothetical protein